jgi:DNA-binding MarR family transcriptional regulator
MNVNPLINKMGLELVPLNCTCGRLRKLSRRMTAFYEQHMRKSGLKLSQYAVLNNISDKPQSLVQLADRLEMDRTTLTRSLKPMLKQGWVAETHGEDARHRLLELTLEGKRFRQHAQASWREAQLALETLLGRDIVAELNKKIEEALTQLKPALPEEN